MKHKELTADQARQMKRSNILRGTIILTIAGFITRFIGFFYRIFLSNTMGAELLGIYQLIFPVYGICFTIFATGIQTSISRLVAAELGCGSSRNVRKILRVGLLLSLSLAVLLSFLLYLNADMVANHFLLEKRSVASLRILAAAFPFCAVTACINGYYYGLKKAGVPAITQLLEQVIRVIFVYVLAIYAGNGNSRVTCELAVIGLVIGEIASCIYNSVSLCVTSPLKQLPGKLIQPHAMEDNRRQILRNLLHLSVPLSANRLLLSILHSIEAILIPAMLRRSGLSVKDSLVIYGILNGMTIPFILFPTALINALAILVLPTVSEAQAMNNERLIEKTSMIAIKYSLIIGVISTGLFILFGRDLGNAVFHNELAGTYLVILAWLCPLIYLTTTLGSIINGLGKANITFINSMISSVCKIILIAFLIPPLGIKGYLVSLLIGQLIVTGLDTFIVLKNVHLSINLGDSVVKPSVVVVIAGYFLKVSYEYIKKMTHMNEVVFLLTFCLLLCVICLCFLYVTRAISRNDFR